MGIINSIAGAVINLALYPFRGLTPIIGLFVFSVVSGVGMLYVFKATSDQDRISEVKRKIHAGIFEIRLFNDDMLTILAAQRDIVRYNLSYIRLSLAPLVWMIVPFFLIVAQLQFHYGYEGIEVEAPAIVKVTLAEGTASGAPPQIELDLPDGIRIDSPRLWIPALGEIDWRIVGEAPGAYEMVIRIDGESYSKSIEVGDALVRRSPFRVSSLLDQAMYPVEAALPSDGPVSMIEVRYPDATVNLLGWETHWLIPFFIFTIAVAFALRKPLGVTF